MIYSRFRCCCILDSSRDELAPALLLLLSLLACYYLVESLLRYCSTASLISILLIGAGLTAVAVRFNNRSQTLNE